jgi:KaiC/GvpD/RAD55 family RecA-like ATPase
VSKRLIDPQNAQELAEALSTLLYFVESVNATAAMQARKTGRQSDSPTNVILQVRKTCLNSHMVPETSELLTLCEHVRVVPQFHVEIVEGITQFLLGPAQFRFDVKPVRTGGHERAATAELTKDYGTPRFTTPARACYERSSRFAVHESGYGSSFDLSVRANLSSHVFRRSGVRAGFCEEVLDPLLIAHAFLIDVVGVNENASGFYIQRWLRQVFKLEMTLNLKHSIPRICERLNTIFFSEESPMMQNVHTARAGVVGTTLIVGEIERCLRESTYDPPQNELGSSSTLPKAIGIFLFLRFVQVFRVRYFWLEEFSNSDEMAYLVAVKKPRQAASALRPIEAGYLKTKIFGVLSSIPGFNAIFRGGLLPRVDEGRSMVISGPPGCGKTTFALHLLADIASQGGIGIYISLEESYNAIVDRLVTFGLTAQNLYRVVSGGQDLATHIKSRHRQSEGMIFLFALADDEQFSIVETLSALADQIGDDFPLRALAVDSINALEFSGGSDQDALRHPALRRILLKNIVDAVEGGRFFGCIITEEGDSRFDTLPYLVDTVMHIGADQQQGRWMRIDKCRSQNYQDGVHTFRMLEGRGVVIYPSLSATRSTLRRRVKNTLSEQRAIPLPGELHRSLGSIAEKSSCLISGPPNMGKSLFLLNLLTEPTLLLENGGNEHHWEIEKSEMRRHRALLVTFRTPEVKVLQAVRQRTGLNQRWQRTQADALLRWYSPGQHLTGDQIIAEMLRYLRRSRRDGQPIERVAFAEIDAAEHVLPALKREELFWPTLFELVTTEAVTAFFVGTDRQDSPPIRFLSSEVDYSYHIAPRKRTAERDSWLELRRKPDLVTVPAWRAAFSIGNDGLVIGGESEERPI